MIYYKYGTIQVLKYLYFVCTLVAAILIVALHNHYTVDVWLAMFVTPFIFLTLNAYWPDKVSTRLSQIIEEEEEDLRKHEMQQPDANL
jgi:ABC-type uncharacterized transport system YnjBCD permease subunit